MTSALALKSASVFGGSAVFGGTAEQSGGRTLADDHVPAAHDSSRSDLDSAYSLADFAQACNRLRAGRFYAELRKVARPAIAASGDIERSA